MILSDYVATSLLNWKTSLPVLLCIYTSYYFICLVQKPKLICNQGKLRQFIERRIPAVKENYYPTFWAPNGHLQTIFRVLMQCSPPVKYTRETIELPDGGTISLDWVDSNYDSYRGLVVIIPGLTGGSESTYSMHLGYKAKLFRCRAVVYNNRGCSGTKLKTPQFACAATTSDLQFVLTHVKRKYKDLPLIVAGVSLGGIMVTNYLSKEHIKQKNIDAAFAACIAWNFHQSAVSLEKPLNRVLYNHHLGGCLKKIANRSKEVLLKHQHELPYDLNDLEKVRTIREFDVLITAPMCGYKSVEEYYTDASTIKKTHKVKIPLVCVSAPDDPFAPGNCNTPFPTEAIAKSSHVALIVTKTGGHIGFMEGLIPIGPTYMERLFAQFLKAFLDHPNELKD